MFRSSWASFRLTAPTVGPPSVSRGRAATRLSLQSVKVRKTPDARRREPRATHSGVKLLVVEDEDAIAEPLVEGLCARASRSSGRRPGRRRSTPSEPDLVLLDLRLPDLDGLEVCRRLRERSQVPIIVVTAQRRGGRPGRRARARGRRLRGQAVRAARADRADQGRPAAHGAGAAAGPVRVDGLVVDRGRAARPSRANCYRSRPRSSTCSRC